MAPHRPRPRPIVGSPTLCLNFCISSFLLPFSYAHQFVFLFFFFDFFSFVFFYNFGFQCLNITKFFVCNFFFCTFIIGLEIFIFIFIIFMLSYRILLCFLFFRFQCFPSHFTPDFNQNFQKLSQFALHIYLLFCACLSVCVCVRV